MTESKLYNADLLEILQSIEDSSDVAIELISDLLTHDKLQEGNLKVDRNPLLIWNLVEKTTSPFFIQVFSDVL